MFAIASAVDRCAAGAPLRVLPLGDSITRGYGSTDSGGYRRYLHSELTAFGWDVDFVGSLSNGNFPDPQHEGHDGAYIRVLHANWALGAQQLYDPDVTLLMIGTNDCWTGTGPNSPQLAPINLDNLIAGIFQVNPDTKLYVATIPRIWDGHLLIEYPSVPQYNAAVRQIVTNWAKTGKFVRLVDVYPELGRLQLFDGVHPNEYGYATIGRLFFDALTNPASSEDAGIPTIGSPTTIVPEPVGFAAGLLSLAWLFFARLRGFFRCRN